MRYRPCRVTSQGNWTGIFCNRNETVRKRYALPYWVPVQREPSDLVRYDTTPLEMTYVDDKGAPCAGRVRISVLMDIHTARPMAFYASGGHGGIE
jgi:hypothetical protein